MEMFLVIGIMIILVMFATLILCSALLVLKKFEQKLENEKNGQKANDTKIKTNRKSGN